jgi:hypothetical protein
MQAQADGKMTKARPPSAERTAYLVLGMHRSGTSAVTQVLALAGAELPENVMPGDEHNAKGYFEPWKIAIFNDRRLRGGASAWDDVFAFPYGALAERDERAWLDDAKALFAEEFAGTTYPLMKDPRVSVLLPFWRQALDELAMPARCVIPVRHPLAVAGSLSKRDGFPVEKSLLLWTAYMLASEAYTRDLPRVFVGYESLLADWRAEVTRIEAAHGAPLPGLTAKNAKAIDGFLTTDLQHNASQGDLASATRMGPIATQVYDWCMAAAGDRQQGPAAMEAAAAQLAEMKAQFGALVSPMTRDLDVARTALADLRMQVDGLNEVLDEMLA